MSDIQHEHSLLPNRCGKMSDKTTNDDDVDATESNQQGRDAIASGLAAASAAASMAVATTSNDITTAATAKEDHVSMGTLWDTLQHEFTQMGRALSCPLCLSTYTDAVILPCVHAYCRECLCDAFKNGQPRCPTCLTRATKRSMVAAPQLQRLVRTYKLALRQFGLVPVTYDPSYQAMTQLGPGDNATAFGGDGEGLTVQIREGGGRGGRRKSSDLVEHHIQLQVSRTWQRVLQERQEEDQARAERFAAARERQQRQSRHSIGKGNAKSTTTAASTASVRFGAEWYQQQQASVIASHERALIDAARRKAPPTTSQQMEGNMENALEQEMANQQMEDDDDNNSDDQNDDNLESNEQENEQNKEEDTTHHLLDFVTTRLHRGDLTITTAIDGNDKGNGNNLGAPAATTNTIRGGDETQESGVFFTASESQQTNNTAATTATTTAATAVTAAQDKEEKESQRPFLSTAESFDTAMSTTGGGERENKTVHTINNNVDSNGDNGDDTEDVDDDRKPSAVDTDTAKNDKTKESERQTLLEEAQQRSAIASSAVSSTRENASFEGATPLQSNTGSRVFHFSNTVVTKNNNRGAAQTAPSNSSGDNEQEVTMDHATSTNDALDTTSSNTPAMAEFKVGDIVQVQSRTWPGVNKPGGIARISKVFDNTSSYHVNYILGGKEKNVDSIFLSLPPEEMNLLEDASSKSINNNEAVAASTTDNTSNNHKRERKSRRISKFDAKVKMEALEGSPVHKNVLPPDLMKQLAAEGFDVAPLAIKTASSKSRSRYSTARVTFKTEGSERPKNVKRSRSAPRSGTAAASGAPSTTKRARQTAKTNRPLQEQNPAVQAKKDAKKRNAPRDDNIESENGKPAAKKSAPSKPRKKAPSVSSGQQDIDLVPPLPETNPEICALADKYCQERVQRALDNNSLCVVSTGLSDSEKKALKALIREAKQCGDVQIKQTEVFHAKKTTLCILPASAANQDDPDNVVGHCRTLKAMRAALAGIPLVSSSWIVACRDQSKIIMPSGFWVRSLPVRNEDNSSKIEADYGVARIAAQPHRVNQCLDTCAIHLSGDFARPPRADVMLLAREAGAALTLETVAVEAFLRKSDMKSRLVLICDDTCTSISDSLKNALLDGDKERVLVVNPSWLFDSIAAGTPMLSKDAYPPAKAKLF